MAENRYITSVAAAAAIITILNIILSSRIFLAVCKAKKSKSRLHQNAICILLLLLRLLFSFIWMQTNKTPYIRIVRMHFIKYTRMQVWVQFSAFNVQFSAVRSDNASALIKNLDKSKREKPKPVDCLRFWTYFVDNLQKKKFNLRQY